MNARDDLVGTTLAGKFLLKRLVGAGAMGTIYEGVHTSLGRRVAVKLLHTRANAEPDVVARFHREARALSVVESDYIVQIFDVGYDATAGLYMIIELLSGEDLQRRIEREERVDVPTAVTIGYHVARGLAKAHAAGVVHRDLKPANIFLTERDDATLVAKILDFGISKVSVPVATAEPDDHDLLTHPGIALGTPQYMSPEQIEAKDPMDGRSDLWSLCAVLYEIIAGRAPFAKGSYLEVLDAIVRAPILPLHHVAPWLPRRVADAVMAGLERDPARRIATAALLANRLLAALPDAPFRASGPFRAALAVGPDSRDEAFGAASEAFIAQVDGPATERSPSLSGTMETGAFVPEAEEEAHVDRPSTVAGRVSDLFPTMKGRDASAEPRAAARQARPRDPK